MKLTQGVAAALLLACGAVAHAEVTGTITAVSDYDFRGISLSAKDPALQGSIDWASEGGFYLGAWASNIDYGDDFDGNIELDWYGGYAGETAGGLGWDVGLVYYTYPDSSGSNKKFGIRAYPELYVGLSYKFFEIKQWYTNSYSGYHDDGWYTEGNLNFELPANFTASAHLGYNYGDAWDKSEFMDYSIGVGYSVAHFDFELKYVDTDLGKNDWAYSDQDAFNTEGRAIFSVSTTFPWSNE